MSELYGVAETPRDVAFEADGWEKQFTCGEPRLSEMVELFTSMGREIHLEPMASEDRPLGVDCEACFTSCGEKMQTIWTRKKI
ncbi:MAG: hypothetical protein QF613_00470 [Candidatus Marinimicrobia bacterium]|jgi:hypothetical protein|nr:hypothetical protein [Candidatus Neomarinimicrobiota bacterium]MDP6456734.1 hypothetical protein [Candidatus Neomarinimicrobiota bacterium]MDP6592675.1 hypothetical protein [Candidatus Neomarinimicrobiota bacterium]MDP6837006.1 hypothetical protein [Candidatus Neomarinimicrobiota bacterium]MDP6966719.1 hypothetical protein [Candidatus Neomarinimicrobiota bacterium]|tara:strand:+ start:1313 stop:1561 length:249 start_codon:yes stop_codon:yes gene_type:complete